MLRHRTCCTRLRCLQPCRARYWEHDLERLIAIALLVLSQAVQANPSKAAPLSECAEHLPFGIPQTKTQDTTEICRKGYALLHDNRWKIPQWVAYRLTAERTVGCSRRTSDWDPEPSIPPGKRAIEKDYAKSDYDIGHMMPNADARWDKQVEVDTNVLSNAAPQLKSLNRGSWATLEERVRLWAVTRREIIVYTGPIWDRVAPKTIGEGVAVPTAFFKVVVDPKSKQVLSFIYPATAKGSPELFRTNLAEVQRRTGLVLPVPPKSTNSRKLWPHVTESVTRSQVCLMK